MFFVVVVVSIIMIIISIIIIIIQQNQMYKSIFYLVLSMFDDVQQRVRQQRAGSGSEPCGCQANSATDIMSSRHARIREPKPDSQLQSRFNRTVRTPFTPSEANTKNRVQAGSINQINILFYVCSHRGDIRQKQKTKTYNYYLY